MSNYSIISTNISTPMGSDKLNILKPESNNNQNNMFSKYSNGSNSKVTNKIIIKDEKVFESTDMYINQTQETNLQSNFLGEINDKYLLIAKIGEGGTSKVYLARSKQDQFSLFAIKIIKNSSDLETKLVDNEINLLMKANNPNIVKILDGGKGLLINEEGKKCVIQFLVLEYLKYGELFNFIYFPQCGFGECLGKYIFVEILKGLLDCHYKGIIHRDIKVENIMITENFDIKISDFGFATSLKGSKNTGLLYTAKGTLNYAPPEILENKPYFGAQADIFSLGVTLFVIVTGKIPFKRANYSDQYYKLIIEQHYDAYWERIKNTILPVSDEFKNLFVLMVSNHAGLRPSLEEIVHSDWLIKEQLKLPKKTEFAEEMNKRLSIINKSNEFIKSLQKARDIDIDVRKSDDNNNKINTHQENSHNEYLIYRTCSQSSSKGGFTVITPNKTSNNTHNNLNFEYSKGEDIIRNGLVEHSVESKDCISKINNFRVNEEFANEIKASKIGTNQNLRLKDYFWNQDLGIIRELNSEGNLNKPSSNSSIGNLSNLSINSNSQKHPSKEDSQSKSLDNSLNKSEKNNNSNIKDNNQIKKIALQLNFIKTPILQNPYVLFVDADEKDTMYLTPGILLDEIYNILLQKKLLLIGTSIANREGKEQLLPSFGHNNNSSNQSKSNYCSTFNSESNTNNNNFSSVFPGSDLSNNTANELTTESGGLFNILKHKNTYKITIMFNKSLLKKPIDDKKDKNGYNNSLLSMSQSQQTNDDITSVSTENYLDFTTDPLTMTLQIKKTNVGYAIEFTKVHGSKVDFYNEFQKIKSYVLGN